MLNFSEKDFFNTRIGVLNKFSWNKHTAISLKYSKAFHKHAHTHYQKPKIKKLTFYYQRTGDQAKLQKTYISWIDWLLLIFEESTTLSKINSDLNFEFSLIQSLLLLYFKSKKLCLTLKRYGLSFDSEETFVEKNKVKIKDLW